MRRDNEIQYLARAIAFGLLFWATALPCSAQSIQFSRDIQPILARHCYACHGPDEQAREGGLALHDTRLMLEPADSGDPAIVPGQPENSILYQRITSKDEAERMPPAEHSEPLDQETIEKLKAWIAAGAPRDAHWSYAPIQRPQLPAVSNADWIRTPVDCFVLARLEAAGLAPEPPAEHSRLLRRLALDLTGLPPDSELLAEFGRDPGDAGYERAVERLLASPAFGEHWARMWLDAARYADSQGYAQDEIRSIWKFRDWVIAAFNRDLPFDQFTLHQLAGDLLPNPTEDQLIATAFHRNTMTNTEGGTDDEEFRHAAVVDRVNTTGTVWLGTTLGCAQCHSHKFDPISLEEYYRFFALFNQTADRDQPDNSPVLEQWTPEQQLARAELESRIRELEQMGSGGLPPNDSLQQELEMRRKELSGLTPVTTPIMRELPIEARRSTRIAVRGSFLTPGDPVEPGVPANLSPGQNASVRDRLELAQWILAPENPLTARVAVNRIWEQIFGGGLVSSLDDFGSQGQPPSHPELLDWLADEFRSRGGSHKQLIRSIVLSATYRQSSRVTREKRERDPENRLYSRSPRYRLSAEQIRDMSLSVSGLLSRKQFGPPVHPPQPKSGLSSAFGGSLDWEPSPGEDRYRRAIYTLWRRTHPYPSFLALDATNRTVCTVRRVRTNTPISAFVTLNDPVYVECAQALARLVEAQTDRVDDTARIHFAVERVLCRPASEEELRELLQLLETATARYQSDLELADKMIGGASLGDEAGRARHAAWVIVANVLLNLDETLTRN